MTERQLRKKLVKMKRTYEQRKRIKELEDAYADYMPNSKKRKVSNVMLFVSVIAIVGYVVANYVLQYKTGIEISPTITQYWFLFWTSEVFLLAGIKTSKVIKGYDNEPSNF